MLIRSLHAENFMKFESIRLENLPPSGIIGIEGPNESGKTTIAEAILFAFFGRARTNKDYDLEHFIRWGGDHLRVEVEFTLPGERDAKERDDFLIFREVDRFGTNYVKVLSLPERRELASGLMEVDEFVRRRIHYDSVEFLHAFYHNQSEPLPFDASLVQLLERLTGISQMDRASVAVTTEIEQLEREFSHYQKDIRRNLHQMERYSQNNGRVAELEEELRKVITSQEEGKKEVAKRTEALEFRRRMVGEREACERQLSELASADSGNISVGVGKLLERYDNLQKQGREGRQYHDEYRSHFRALVEKLTSVRRLYDDFKELCRSFAQEREKVLALVDANDAESLASRWNEAEKRSNASRTAARRSGAKVKVLGVVFVLLAAVAVFVGVWPEADGWLRSLGVERVLATNAVAGASLVVVAVLIGQSLRSRRLSREDREARESLPRLSENLRRAREENDLLARLAEIGDDGLIGVYLEKAMSLAKGVLAERVRDFEKTHGELFKTASGSESGACFQVLADLAISEKKAREKLTAWTQTESKKLKERESQLRKLRGDRDRLDNELRECTNQLARTEAIEEKNRDLEKSADTIRKKIEDHRCARTLLSETTEMIRMKLGPTLGSLIQTVLPHLTDGRYRDVKVGECMDIRVFSRDKSDFVSAAELSGGTNEGLMLALRLAFAQAFVASRSRQPQFVLLDEPFRMMDVGRALAAVDILRKISPDLLQFIIIQPNYTDSERQKFDYLVRTSLDTTRLEISFSRV